MKTMYNYSYIYDYYPESIREVSSEQERNRQEVQDFMTGELSQTLVSKVIENVRAIAAEDRFTLVCFAPGTTGAKTILRFSELALTLSEILDCGVYLDAVTLRFDSDPITHERYYQCEKGRVRGQDVLLIGGVYTTGDALQEVGDLVMRSGAKSVRALFIAKTISE